MSNLEFLRYIKLTYVGCLCDMTYYIRMMTDRNTICIGQHLYRTEVSRSTEVAAPSNNRRRGHDAIPYGTRMITLKEIPQHYIKAKEQIKVPERMNV